MRLSRGALFAFVAVMVIIIAPGAGAVPPVTEPTLSLLASGLQGATGSTVGPGGDLYVTEAIPGRISRIDPKTGEVTTFATGLPPRAVRIGGAMDLAFIGSTAYVLVTLVEHVGIYRMDGPDTFTLIADIGAFAAANPPDTPFGVPTGVQYAIEPYRGGFLVTDGHHNRVYHVTLDGEVSEFLAFPNIVPTGLAVSGNTIFMAQAGPVPHLPEDGKVVAFGPDLAVVAFASGAPLLVDVEFGRGRQLYALSQGDFPPGERDGFPALPDTGALVEVNDDGTLTVVVDGLNQPTSVDFIGNTAYVVNLAGEVWKIENVGSPPFGASARRTTGTTPD